MPPDGISLFERLVLVRGHYVLTVTVSHCLETQEGLCFPVDPNSQPSVIVICIYIQHDRNFSQVLSSNCFEWRLRQDWLGLLRRHSSWYWGPEG